MKYRLFTVIAFVVLLLVPITVVMADIMDGLVAYWPFEDRTGEVAHDYSENGHDGALEDGPSWTDDSRMGAGALAFDGVDDRIVVDAFDLEGGTGITLAAWIKPDSLGGVQSRIISKAEGGGTPDHYWAVVLAGNGENDLEFRLRTDSGAPSRVTTPDGEDIEAGVWTHLAVTWDAADPNMRFYKNGEEIHSTGKGGAAVGVGPDVKIGVGNQSVSAGADSMDRPFNGIMDDVAIWNRGLSAAEIADMMTVGIPVAVEPGGKLTTAWGAVKY